jgi:hypothetical protein
LSTLKGIGKVPGKFDTELLEFLKFTNGASILDYCFLGFKNHNLVADIDKFMLQCWGTNILLAGRFLPFMITSTGDIFGYLIDIVDEFGRHPVLYYSDNDHETFYIIGSSFASFMRTFISDLQEALNKNKEGLQLGIDQDDWPIDLTHWLEHDKRLKVIYNDGTLERYFKNNLPKVKWY